MLTNILLAVIIATLVVVIVTPAHKINEYYKPWVMGWVIVLTICAVIVGLIE